MIEQIKTQTKTVEEIFINPNGVEFIIKPASGKKGNSESIVTSGDGDKWTIKNSELEDFIINHGLKEKSEPNIEEPQTKIEDKPEKNFNEPQKEVLSGETKENNFNILEVKKGDILEMSDGSYLKITANDKVNEVIKFEHIEPDGRTDKPGENKERPYAIMQGYQDEISEYIPRKANINRTKKESADEILAHLDTRPPENIDLETPKEDKLVELEPVVAEKPKRGRPKKVVETPPAVKQSLEEAGKIMAELEASPKPEKQKIPLNLKKGQVLWNDRGEEAIVVDVQPKSKKENPDLNPDLKDGYVVLGFPPKKGRNGGYVREFVSFSKLEEGKDKIFFTEQTPFIEIDEKAEQEEKAPKFESTAFADLKESLEKEGKWPESENNKKKESPPLPEEYLAKVSAKEKQEEENRRLEELREEMREISHGDLRSDLDNISKQHEPKITEEFDGISHGDLKADLTKHWTPIDVEMPKREPPLSPSLRKLPKKPWWKKLFGL